MGIKRRSSVSPSPARPAPAPARAAAPAPARPAPVQQPAQQHHTAPAQHQSHGGAMQPHGQHQQPMMHQQHQQPMMQQQHQQPMMQHAPPAQQGGGLMSNIAGGIMNGMTFGVGSAVANRAVDAIMGPRTVQHEYVNAPPAAAPAAAAPEQQQIYAHCSGYNTNYQNCLSTNTTNPSACGDFMSALQQCQSGRQ